MEDIGRLIEFEKTLPPGPKKDAFQIEIARLQKIREDFNKAREEREARKAERKAMETERKAMEAERKAMNKLITQQARQQARQQAEFNERISSLLQPPESREEELNLQLADYEEQVRREEGQSGTPPQSRSPPRSSSGISFTTGQSQAPSVSSSRSPSPSVSSSRSPSPSQLLRIPPLNSISGVGSQGVGQAVSGIGAQNVGQVTSSIRPQSAFGPVSNVGTQGALGAVSNVGMQGVGQAVSGLGPQGALGPVSNVGTQGVGQAVSGLRPQGALGPVSSIGTQGAVGPVSSIGTQGAVGPVSSIGTQGAVGPVSSIGTQGAVGPVSIIRTQGVVGPIGNVSVQGLIVRRLERGEMPTGILRDGPYDVTSQRILLMNIYLNVIFKTVISNYILKQKYDALKMPNKPYVPLVIQEKYMISLPEIYELGVYPKTNFNDIDAINKLNAILGTKLETTYATSTSGGSSKKYNFMNEVMKDVKNMKYVKKQKTLKKKIGKIKNKYELENRINAKIKKYIKNYLEKKEKQLKNLEIKIINTKNGLTEQQQHSFNKKDNKNKIKIHLNSKINKKINNFNKMKMNKIKYRKHKKNNTRKNY